jgi:hypothetical protein
LSYATCRIAAKGSEENGAGLFPDMRSMLLVRVVSRQ